MAAEQVTVSRKTPLDGRLEIPRDLSARLDRLGGPFDVQALGSSAAATTEAMECTCAKSAGARHVHYFVVSPLLRGLSAGTVVSLHVDESARVLRVQPAI